MGAGSINRVYVEQADRDFRPTAGKNHTAHRLVNERDGDMLTATRARRSKRPLPLGGLIEFVRGAWPSTDAGDQTPGGAGKASGATVAPGVPLATAS